MAVTAIEKFIKPAETVTIQEIFTPVKVQEILTREFPKEQVRYRPGRGGKQISYVETYSVIERLNEAFESRWSWELQFANIADKQIYCKGRLTVNIDGETIIKESFGSKDFSTGNTGDDLKAASSDALKKAASLLGIGLYFYKDKMPGGYEKPDQEKVKNYIKRW